MGKKKEKIEIRLSDEELMPVTIGVLEETKSSSVGLIIIFAIFTLFAVFLPNISEWANKLLGKDTGVIVAPNNGNADKEKEKEEQKAVMHDLSENLEFTYDDIKFSKFNVYENNNKYYISINLSNTSDTVIDLGDKKYYLETYSEGKTLLSRHIFKNMKLNVKDTSIQTIELSDKEYNEIKKIVIVKKTEKDYPEVSLKENNNKQYTLTCVKDNSNIVYTFDKDKMLIRIKDTFNMGNDNSISYKQNLSSYQNQVANLNNKNGISSSLVEISTGFTATTDITIKEANLKDINNDNYYKDASPKVIDFEMESRGYSCN